MSVDAERPPEIYDWETGFRVLGDLLNSRNGCVSTRALRNELEKNGVTDARDLCVALQFFDFESSSERTITPPQFRFYHLGRSFYSKEKYDQELKKLEREADHAGRDAERAVAEEVPSPRTNRQEEARLVTYVKGALEELYYSSDTTPEDKNYVFDVHSARAGSSFENVDLLAVHWRSRKVCDLVTVEVKLEFSAQVVHQALNYTRFSHRAWIAVPVETDENSELRERNPALFEYAISHGLGILACRRRQGGRYDVFPIHWPLRHQPLLLEEEEFLERYRNEFEEAGALEPRERNLFPRFR